MILLANKNNQTDGSAYNMLQRLNCHVPIVLVTRIENFEFNDELLGLDKYVVIDFSEHSWNFDFSNGTPIFGKNFDKYKGHFFNNEGYAKLNQFITDRKPLLYFKRELLKADETEYCRPIEYCSWHSATIETEEQFNNRKIEVFFNWGLSNPSRPMLHGDIWKYSHDFGYSVCDSFYSVQKFLDEEKTLRKWVSINTPHYVRQPVENVLQVNGMSKLSVSLFGAGRKCFRTTGESPLNAVMILPEDDMAYNFEWKDGVNCIKIKHGETDIEAINNATKRKDLFEIYKNSHATCEKYCVTNYTKYLSEIINVI